MALKGSTIDRIQSIAEYILCCLWILAGVQTSFLPPFEQGGVIVVLFGGQIALYIYVVWFIFLGLWLLWAKLFKKRKAHKWSLFAMFLTTIYTGILSTVIVGWGAAHIIDDLIIGAVSAACWLRWKFRTEYLNPRQWHSLISEVNHDTRD